jgi:hypothetical protein
MMEKTKRRITGDVVSKHLNMRQL